MRSATCLYLIVISNLLAVTARAEMIPLSTSLESTGFEHVSTRRGVDVYLHPTREPMRFAAEGLIRAAPASLFQALLDYDRQVGELGNLAEARILTRNASSALVYQRLSLPMVNDRDLTMRVRWGEKGDTLWLLQQNVSGRGPAPREGVVRIGHHIGSWQLAPRGSGRSTFARFESSIDLGGALDGWLTRSAMSRALPTLFDALGRLAGAS